MDKFEEKKRHISRPIIIAVIVVAVLAVLFVGFKLLVKVGNPKYFYNYLHDTEGSRTAVVYADNIKGADSEKAFCTDNTSPEAHGVVQKIEDNGVVTDSRDMKGCFDFSEKKINELSSVPALTTFRGNYWRNMSSVGNAVMKNPGFKASTWTFNTGKILKSNGADYWSGNGWTGQPVAVKWDSDVRRLMNMTDEAKNRDDLVEIIYPGMDGSIHFLDMETGKQTRQDIYVGMTFKGTASIYPDGRTPLLFCGSGDAQTGPFGENVSQRFYIFSLIDGSLLYEGGFNDGFAPRVWHAYDSSPIIDPESDRLIYPGENGVIYTMRLNTEFDEQKGTISVAPDDIVKYSFTIDGKYSEGGVLWGSECSGSVWNHYLYLGDNGGSVFCIDLDTMQMVWINEVNEDINSSVIFESDGGNRFIYVATTLKYGYNTHNMGEACIYKLNAMNGEIVWKKPYEVHTVKGYAGGVLSTGALGSGKLSDYLFYSVSKTPELEGGYLVALNKYSGEEIWKLDLDMYSWSSTGVVNSTDGKTYLVQGCQNGDLLLIDAEKGTVLDKMNFGSGIEATPAVFGNRIVLATRSEKIIGVELE